MGDKLTRASDYSWNNSTKNYVFIYAYLTTSKVLSFSLVKSPEDFLRRIALDGKQLWT